MSVCSMHPESMFHSRITASSPPACERCRLHARHSARGVHSPAMAVLPSCRQVTASEGLRWLFSSRRAGATGTTRRREEDEEDMEEDTAMLPPLLPPPPSAVEASFAVRSAILACSCSVLLQRLPSAC